MPMFQYICTKCNTSFEDINNDICPECKGKGEKILSASNFIIKGSCSNPMNTEKIKENNTTEIPKKVLSDWYCTKCNFVEEDEIRYPNEEYKCPKCQGIMRQLVGKFTFELKYDPKKDLFDWQGNRSQYWSVVKAERRKGRDVKGHNEL